MSEPLFPNATARIAHPLPAAPTFLPAGLSALTSRAVTSLSIAAPINPAVSSSSGGGAGGSGPSAGTGVGGAINPLFIRPRPGYEDKFVPRSAEDKERDRERERERISGRSGGSKRRHSPSPPSYRDRHPGPSRDYDRDRDRNRDRSRSRSRDRDRHDPRPRLSTTGSSNRPSGAGAGTSQVERERPGFIKERSPLAGGAGGAGSKSANGRSGSRDRNEDGRASGRRDERTTSGGTNGLGKLKHPDEDEAVKTYRDYAIWARNEEPDLIEKDDKAVSVPGQRRPLSAAYHAYRQRFSSRQLWALFLAHRDEPWFEEKYADEPELVSLRKQIMRNGSVPAIKKFLAELEEGKHEGVNFDAEPTSSVPSTYGPEYLDDQGLCHVRPGKNQVFIKAIPVECSRPALHAILSQAGEVEYIAIGDPIQKKGFMRAGWAQYKEGTQMSKVVRELRDAKLGDFHFHITENSVDHLNKIRQAPGVCSTIARFEVDIAQAKSLAAALEAPLKSSDVDMDGKSNGKVAPTLEAGSAAAIEIAVAKVLEQRGLSKDELTEDEKKEKLRIELDHWLLYLRRGLHTCYYCVSNNDHEEELYRKCIRHVRVPATEASQKAAVPYAAGTGPDDIFGGHQKVKEEEGDEAEDEHHGDASMMDMDREREVEHYAPDGKGKDGSKDTVELRKTASSERRWVQWVDKKIRLITHPSEIDPTEYYGRDLEAEKAKISGPLIKREDDSKYRCVQCSKCFKAPEFLYKHVPTKHPDLFTRVIADTKYFNAFCLDPQHLIPHRYQPASVKDRLPSTTLLPQQIIPDQTRNTARENGRSARPVRRDGTEGRGPGSARRDGGLLSRVGGYANDGPSSRRDRNGNDRDRDRERERPAPSLDAALMDERLLAPPAVPDDPRASRGRVNYRDLDAPQAVPDGGGLPY